MTPGLARARVNDEPRKATPAIVAGRVPPHDLDAEAAVLSAVLLSRDALDRVLEVLKPDHFYSDANGRIYDAAVQLSIAGTPVDIVSVASYLRDRETLAAVGGSVYLAQLSDATPAVANVVTHAKIVVEKWRLRALIATCQRVSAEGYGDVGEVQAFIDGAENDIGALSRTDERREMTSLGAALAEEWQEMTARIDRGETMVGFSTGYGKLDERLAGMAPGDFTILAGRPGMGKSAGAMGIAVNVAAPRRVRVPDEDGRFYEVDAEGLGVCVFSLEMPRPQLVGRTLCTEARVDINRMRTGRLMDADWPRLTEAAGFLTRLPLWIDDTPAMTLLDIRAKVRRRQAEYSRPAAPGLPERKVALVVVDYLQLMKGAGRERSREEEISGISRGLKQLAKDLGVHVLALAQLNRGPETRSTKDKRPQMSDLRESGSLEQDADNVILMYRHEYYFPGEKAGIAEWDARKVRNGPPGKVFLHFDGPCTRFDNLAAHEYPQDED